MADKGNGAPRRIRYGMVGGGQGAFIGAVHRLAARMDDQYELVAGALSSDPARAAASAAEVGIDPGRSYADYSDMARRERRLRHGIEAVSIVTPNHLHAPIAKTFLKAGIHVICDKPLTTTVREANALVKLTEEKGLIFAVTHNYSGYPMIRQAQAMVRAGELGDLRVVQVEYAQDWLTEEVHNKQADWRTDPEQSGAGGCVGDIGTHAYQLAAFVTGLKLQSLTAELTTFVPGRRLDDNVQVMLRYEGGARGALWTSQVAPGNENTLRLRIYGAKGGLEWGQENPNLLWWTPFGQEKRLITRAGAGSGEEAGRLVRVPPGHPEGYLEGFANIYTEVAHAIRAARGGETLDAAVQFPTVKDGADGMRFIDAAVRSSKRNSAWVKL